MAKSIIVTGASRGLGLAIAEYLLRNGHNVVALARNEEALEVLRNRYPKQARALAGDLIDFSLAQEATDLAMREFGSVDGLMVNHATIGQLTTVANCDMDQWKRDLDTNFMSAVAMIKAAIPELRKSKGCLLVTSSGAGVSSYKSMGFYGATKAAMIHLVQTVSEEEPNITGLSIAPGMVDTQMQQEMRSSGATMDENQHQKFVRAHENGLLLRPEVPGAVMANLALNPPKHMSGRYLRWNAPELESYQEH